MKNSNVGGLSDFGSTNKPRTALVQDLTEKGKYFLSVNTRVALCP